MLKIYPFILSLILRLSIQDNIYTKIIILRLTFILRLIILQKKFIQKKHTCYHYIDDIVSYMSVVNTI